jgi:hypothetical protein
MNQVEVNHAERLQNDVIAVGEDDSQHLSRSFVVFWLVAVVELLESAVVAPDDVLLDDGKDKIANGVEGEKDRVDCPRNSIAIVRYRPLFTNVWQILYLYNIDLFNMLVTQLTYNN